MITSWPGSSARRQQSPRPYHLVCSPDHARHRATVRQRYGRRSRTSSGALADARYTPPPRSTRRWGAWARAGRCRPGARFRRAYRERSHTQPSVEGTVALGTETAKPGPARLARAGLGEGGGLLVSGNLGLIYLRTGERLTLEADRETAPATAGHPQGPSWIGFVMVPLARAGHIVIGGRRRRRSRRQRRGRGSARPLRRDGGRASCVVTIAFPTARTILVNSMYDPDTTRWLRSRSSWAHTAVSAGRRPTRSAVVPSGWSDPASPIVGVEAMHVELRDWIARSRGARDDRGQAG